MLQRRQLAAWLPLLSVPLGISGCGFALRQTPALPFQKIALTGFAGIELSQRLGNVSGGLPFTVVFGREGQVLQRHTGETRYEQLADWTRGFS